MTKSKKKAAPKAASKTASKAGKKSAKSSVTRISSMAAKKSAGSNKAAAKGAAKKAPKKAAAKPSPKKAAAGKANSKKSQGALASLRKLIVDTVAASTSEKPKKNAKTQKAAGKSGSLGGAKVGGAIAASLNGAARAGRGRPKLGARAGEAAQGKVGKKGRGRKAAAGGVVLTEDAIPMAGPSIDASSDVCREVACDGLSTTGGYCRLHYIKNWRRVKRKEMILKEGKLNQYIEELVAKYPDKYIEAIRHDLANDKDFSKVIYDLDLDETVDEFDVEGEAVESLIDNIKRDFEDEGEF